MDKYEKKAYREIAKTHSPMNLGNPSRKKGERFTLSQYRKWVRQVIDYPAYIGTIYDSPIPIYHFSKDECLRLAYAIKLELLNNPVCKKNQLHTEYLNDDQPLMPKYKYLEYIKGSNYPKNGNPWKTQEYCTFHDAWALALTDIIGCHKIHDPKFQVSDWLMNLHSASTIQGLHPQTDIHLWQNMDSYLDHTAWNAYGQCINIESSYPLIDRYRTHVWFHEKDNINWNHTSMILRAIEAKLDNGELLTLYKNKWIEKCTDLHEKGYTLTQEQAMFVTFKNELTLLSNHKKILQMSPIREMVGAWLLSVPMGQQKSMEQRHAIYTIIEQIAPSQGKRSIHSDVQMNDIEDALKAIGLTPKNFIAQWNIARDLEFTLQQWIAMMDTSTQKTMSLEVPDVLFDQ